MRRNRMCFPLIGSAAVPQGGKPIMNPNEEHPCRHQSMIGRAGSGTHGWHCRIFIYCLLSQHVRTSLRYALPLLHASDDKIIGGLVHRGTPFALERRGLVPAATAAGSTSQRSHRRSSTHHLCPHAGLHDWREKEGQFSTASIPVHAHPGPCVLPS